MDCSSANYAPDTRDHHMSEPETGLEPTISALQVLRSTIELFWLLNKHQ